MIDRFIQVKTQYERNIVTHHECTKHWEHLLFVNQQTKYLSAFEWDMVVGARRTGLCVSRTAKLLGFSRSTVSRLYQEWSTTQMTTSQLDTTVGSIGGNLGQRPCGTLSTTYRVHAPTILGYSEGKMGCNSIVGKGS